MELTERFTSKCSEQIEENNKLRLINSQKQEENVKLLIDLSMQKAEYETEHQVRAQLANQLRDAQKVIEQVCVFEEATVSIEPFIRIGSFETIAEIEKLRVAGG